MLCDICGEEGCYYTYQEWFVYCDKEECRLRVYELMDKITEI